MIELELVGFHDDGEHLTLKGAGQYYRLAITEELRAAVRRDRPQLEQLRAHTLRPREIQVMIRAGASAEDVAAQAGLPVESVRRYEGPVLAERGYVADRARSLPAGRGQDVPTLGDLVIDRLAARNISDVAWDARRDHGGPWQVFASYRAGTQDFLATWEVDLTGGTFRALDDEARWLSEVDLADSPYRHLTPVADRFYDVETDGGLAEDDPSPQAEDAADPTHTILEELDSARGVRQPLEPEGHEEPTLWDDPPAAHPPLSRPQDATDATILQLPDSAQEQPGTAEQEAGREQSDSPRRRRPRGRTSVPSWDEIVFGAKND